MYNYKVVVFEIREPAADDPNDAVEYYDEIAAIPFKEEKDARVIFDKIELPFGGYGKSILYQVGEEIVTVAHKIKELESV